jgi:hypothetical protein
MLLVCHIIIMVFIAVDVLCCGSVDREADCCVLIFDVG